MDENKSLLNLSRFRKIKSIFKEVLRKITFDQQRFATRFESAETKIF